MPPTGSTTYSANSTIGKKMQTIPAKIGDYRKPGTVDFTLMEAKLRKHLEGKFFNVDGDDINEALLLKREAKKREITHQMELRRAAAIKRAARLEAFGKLSDMRKGEITIEKIIAAVAYAHGIQMSDISSESRFDEHTRARHHVVWLARTLIRASFPAIGRSIHRDHSSCQHAFKKWDQIKPRFAAQVAIVNSILIDGKEVPA